MKNYLTFAPCCSWGTTWSYNVFNVNALGIANDFVLLPLAIKKYPSLTDFEPQLATRWEASPGKIVIHLRPGAKWQDNTPLTSKDVVDTAFLGAIRGDGFWNDITGIKADDDHTVTFTLKKGQPQELALGDILGIRPYPSSIYGSFVTDGLKKDSLAYWNAFHSNPTKAATMPEFRRMSDTFQKLASYKVDKYIGNGPFQLGSVTTKEAKLPKWNGFWGADRIKLAGIHYMNGSNQTIYPLMFSNSADFSNVYLPGPILKKWESTPNSNTALPLGFGFVMVFNSHQYPLNIKEVRQALAYAIPRDTITESAYGADKAAGGRTKDVITGLSPTFDDMYLGKDFVSSLNPYRHDANKASQLLTKAGFTKRDGKWYTPKGSQFTLHFTVNADTSDIVSSFTSASKVLTSFGIDADVKAMPGAQQDADQHNGDFTIGMALVGGDNPLGLFSSLLGPGSNFSKQGNYAGKRGIGFGPVKDIPGLGKVDVATSIDNAYHSTPPGDGMKVAARNWARAVNDEVPYIWYATKVYQFSYSTKNFDNWPPTDKSGTGPLWDIISNNMTQGVSLAIQQGYITPR